MNFAHQSIDHFHCRCYHNHWLFHPKIHFVHPYRISFLDCKIDRPNLRRLHHMRHWGCYMANLVPFPEKRSFRFHCLWWRRNTYFLLSLGKRNPLRLSILEYMSFHFHYSSWNSRRRRRHHHHHCHPNLCCVHRAQTTFHLLRHLRKRNTYFVLPLGKRNPLRLSILEYMSFHFHYSSWNSRHRRHHHRPNLCWLHHARLF
mmetsp:Transcript_46284/g.69828  ORF Transcript_46284/g.69828 Transcript_46284/m.69828 type:complete len:201 (-) Transcript_46284:902-1504(-)